MTLATAKVDTVLSNISGRAIATARGHHFIVDSPPPLGGPNEELNPVDILLAALSTCAAFVCETAAREMDLSLQSVNVHTEGDFDPRGVKGEDVDPRIQVFRVNIQLTGVTQEQGEALVEQFQKRCPIYTTLSRSAPIEISLNVSN